MKDTRLTPNPDPNPGPTPIPSPQPFPDPFPKPEPIPLPPDWWRCLRLGGISGRYEGEMSSPNAGKYALDLRVDIDIRHANSPVMSRISGDIYQVYNFTWFGHTFKWRVYRESWIVDNPTVTWSRCSVVVTGSVRYWKGVHILTNVQVVIPWGMGKIGSAEVTFSTVMGISSSKYSCEKKSNTFREVTLEVDVCQSVNKAPILPTCNTCAHPNRPADLPCRTLTIEEAYAEAGIDITINPTHTIINDSATQFNTWSPAELHDAMELYFSQYPGTWPKWQMWCLLAGSFDNSGVAGIMFDAAAAYGGAGEVPERQGCAVFRNHSWFNDLVSSPTTNVQNAAMRKLLYCYVHEMGHAFNLLHSWDKGRPDALSWMNYDWKYDARNGTNTFWDNFRFKFDDEELIHMRHGDYASVIMGGDPWASGGHMEAPPGAMADQMGKVPIELLVRSKSYFRFLEPVIVELRIKNITNLPLQLDTELHPEFGGVIIYISRPDGQILEYAPILCKIATHELTALKPKNDAIEGEDRHSQNIFLSYGAYGHYFDTPGDYLVRAVYQGAGDVLVFSPVHRLRVGHPVSQEENRIAQDFFTYQAGMALYLNGSSSPFLEKGMATLQDMADRFKESPVGASVSLALAQNLARPFFRIEKKKLVEYRPANPKEALVHTAQALEQQKRDESTFTNITYHELHRTRANLLVAMDKKTEAKKELNTLVKDLRERGVNKPILDRIEAYTKSL